MILEYPYRLESVFLDEVHKRLEVCISLSRESYDKCGTYKRIWKVSTDILDEAIDMSTIVVATHELQYMLARMLEWYIEVGEKMF